MRILVTGGAGYIGSHAVRQLLEAGHDVHVLDDLSHAKADALDNAARGLKGQARFTKASTGDRPAVTRLLREAKIEAVLHFAAFIEVGESVADPAKYYRNNFSSALELLAAMKDAGIHRFVFSSTAAVYGNPDRTPIDETASLRPINPYGRSKYMVELALADYAQAYGLGFATFRYFNVAGASPSGHVGECHEPESHLIPRVLRAAAQGEEVGIYGTDYSTRDGTCLRDYIHVDDLVAAHLLALERIQPARGLIYNLGSETGFTVREVIAACERVTGRKIRTAEKPRRPGDPAELVASSRKARAELGWQPRFAGLNTIISHAWAWEQMRAPSP